jgi:hypothetical protein
MKTTIVIADQLLRRQNGAPDGKRKRSGRLSRKRFRNNSQTKTRVDLSG